MEEFVAQFWHLIVTFINPLNLAHPEKYTEALRDTYQLILLDPRGQGRSDAPHDPELYSLRARAGAGSGRRRGGRPARAGGRR